MQISAIVRLSVRAEKNNISWRLDVGVFPGQFFSPRGVAEPSPMEDREWDASLMVADYIKAYCVEESFS